jgi:hypothetical protein
MDSINPDVATQFTADAATKSAILANGGGTLELAIAMLETDNLLANYPFGDSKTGDAANFGIYKMNWYMIQQCTPAKVLIGDNLASTALTTAGTTINSDPALATRILLEATERWSMAGPEPSDPVSGNFWAGQRWGQSGLDNLAGTNWDDIQNYYLAVQAIKAKCDLDPTVWISDVRYSVYVPPV